MKFIRVLAFGAAIICGFDANAVLIPTSATIYLDGQAGSWVSGALPAPQVTWTQGSNGTVSTYIHPYWHDAVVISIFNATTSWQFAFAAPTNDPAGGLSSGNVPGVGYYANAVRWPFEPYNQPGMEVSGNGRGENTLTGWFDILDLQLNAAGTEITSVAIDFDQWGGTEAQSGPSLYGSIRINSDLPVDLRPVPEPSTWLLMSLGLLYLGRTTLRGAFQRAQRLCSWRMGPQRHATTRLSANSSSVESAL